MAKNSFKSPNLKLQQVMFFSILNLKFIEFKNLITLKLKKDKPANKCSLGRELIVDKVTEGRK